MKRYSTYIFTMFFSLFLTNCANEELLNNKDEIVAGLPTTVNLAFRASDTQKIETKADDISKDDKVHDLTIFVFDSATKEIVGAPKQCTEDEISKNSITLQTTSGNRLIYAVANINSTNWKISSALGDVKTLEDLNNLQALLNNESVTVLDGMILMSGWFQGTGTAEQGFCPIPAPSVSGGNVNVVGKIELRRIVSSVRFKINCSSNKGKFVPSSWQVKNLPLHSALVEQENDNISGYFNTSEFNRFEQPVTADKNSFAFLMMENRKFSNPIEGQTINNDNSLKLYDLREKAEDKVENFKYAPGNSTYLVLKGNYTGKTNYDANGNETTQERDVTAEVTYYVHLGYVDRDLTDFSISRNYQYIYTLTITDVSKIILEVTKDSEENDFASGDGQVYLPDTQVEILDAHYETRVLSFKKDIIDGIKEESKNTIKRTDYSSDAAYKKALMEDFKEHFQIVASTPKNGFNFDSQDVDWVEFRKNPRGQKTLTSYRDTESTEPLNVEQFQESLYELSSTDYENDLVYYTCYINEYFYKAKELPLSEFVNAPNRMLQINYKFKNAGNQASASTLTTAAYVLSQRSIQSIYDLSKEQNGWGVEWENESGELEYSTRGWYNIYDKKGVKNYSDGRSNMLSELEFKQNGTYQWNTYVKDDQVNSVQMQTNYAYAYAACLSRNRDLNRNGRIDEDEVRWYLPAINQYVALWIGAPALNPQCRLYPFTEGIPNTAYHYISNSTMDGKNVRIIWSEEGASLGNYYESGDNNYGRRKMFRCVRNLGTNIAQYNDYIRNPNNTYYSEEIKDQNWFDIYTAKIFKYPALDSKALRNNIRGVLGDHNHLEEENYLSKTGFYVLDEISYSSCPKGWRQPNQRELTILTSYLEGILGIWQAPGPDLGSCTKYGFKQPDVSDVQYYWFEVAGDASYGNVRKGGSHSIYRCVKDIPEN